jgi:hypothetical protein
MVNTLIARSTEAPPRVFPPVGPDLYDLIGNGSALSPDQRVAVDVLCLANRDLPALQRLSGWGLDGTDQLGRLLHLHKLALEAELAGRWRQADFFWDAVHDRLSALADQTSVWQQVVETLSNRPRVVVLNEPRQLCRRLVHEVFVDLHCAFYNGYLQAGPAATSQHRAFAHVDRILGLVEIAPLPTEDLQTVLAPALESRITLCEEEQHWDRAVDLCAALLAHLPQVEETQDRLAGLYLASTLSNVKKAKSRRTHLKNAQRLREGIIRLDRMCGEYPRCAVIYEALGHLHHQRAISQANGGEMVEAVLSAQKAVAYHPGLKQARETRDALVKAMLQLQVQVKALQERVARQPRARLTPEGSRLVGEAHRGFGPSERFLKMDAPQITAAVNTANGTRLWRAIGLPEPLDRPDDRSRALLVGMSQVMAQPPSDPEGVALAWSRVTKGDENLADLDPGPICGYLSERLFEGQPAAVPKPATAPRATPQQPPVMAGTVSQRQPSSEPFAFWLFSSKDRRIKLQAVAAILLVLLVGFLAIRDLSVRAARSAAFTRIVAAAEREDALGIIQGAEAFFSNRPLSGVDGRDQQVIDLYTEAFVRWFVGLDSAPDTDAEAHVDRYQALILDADRQGGESP